MSYHSELDAERRATEPSDDALAAAERKGARAALTRLAEVMRQRRYDLSGEADAQVVEKTRDDWYPAPRVRAVVEGRMGTSWNLHDDVWRPSLSGARPMRYEVAAMYALQQRADPQGFVRAEVGTDETVGEWCKGSSQAGTREWRVVVKNPRATAHVTLTFHPRECPSGPDEHIWHTHNADVREVRPLTAAQVEALAKALQGARARPHTVATDEHVWCPEARAALAHLGIPYEEA